MNLPALFCTVTEYGPITFDYGAMLGLLFPLIKVFQTQMMGLIF